MSKCARGNFFILNERLKIVLEGNQDFYVSSKPQF